MHLRNDSRAAKRGEDRDSRCARSRNWRSVMFADVSVGGVGSAPLRLAARVVARPPHMRSRVRTNL